MYSTILDFVLFPLITIGRWISIILVVVGSPLIHPSFLSKVSQQNESKVFLIFLKILMLLGASLQSLVQHVGGASVHIAFLHDLCFYWIDDLTFSHL